MNREATELWSAALGAAGAVIRYGHWGRPVLVFPSEQGRAAAFENNGMVAAVEGLIDAGRLKLYCVDSYDAASWSNPDIPLEERARRHGRYESWIVGDVVPWIYRDYGGQPEVVTLGCSLGAALTFAHLACVPDARVHTVVSMGGLVTWVQPHIMLRAAFFSPRLVELIRVRNTRAAVGRILPLLVRYAPDVLPMAA